MEIFGKNAPDYWEKGLPVIPLLVMDKRPFFKDWSRFCSAMPTKEEMDQWTTLYKNNNMGLPCGTQSGLVMVDYDYNNPLVEAAMMRVLPKSPWHRVGQRGKVMAYRYNNTASSKIFDAQGKIVIEIISTGGQVVLPPSIHPKTMQPYVANAELKDILPDIPLLPDNAEELLRGAIGQIIDLKQKGAGGNKFKMLDHVPDGARDIQMNRYAGFLARSVLHNNVAIKAALNDMQAWFDSKVQKKDGDDIDVRKGQSQVIQYVLRDVISKNKVLPTGWDTDLTDEEKTEWGLNFDESHEEWTYEQIIEHIDKIHSSFGPNDPERSKLDTFMINKLAKSKSISPVDEGKILNKLRGDDTKRRISDYNKMLKIARNGPIEGKSHTEIAESVIEEVQEKYGQIAFYQDDLWGWEGSHWDRLPEQVIRSFIQREFGYLELGKRFSDHKGIVQVVKDLVPQTIRPDVTVEGINFANGFVNRDLNILAHNPDFGMTYTLPFQYKPELSGKCPRFLEFLHTCWGHDPDYHEKVTALRQSISSTLFGMATSFQHCFLLYGAPNTGKSVLMNIVSAMVSPEAYCAIGPDQWEKPFIPAQFSGKILNVAGELHETKRIDGKLFKEIISGEEITAENKNRDPFKFRPKAAHWFASNHLPRTKDVSGGFTRRWLIFTFNRVVPSDRIIRDLDNMIVYEEMEAIVAWALEEWPGLCKAQNYVYSESHKNAVREMALQNSNIRQWMADRVVVKPGAKTDEHSMWRDYWAYAAMSNMRSLGPKPFSIDLNQFLIEEGKKQGVHEDGGLFHYDIALTDRPLRK